MVRQRPSPGRPPLSCCTEGLTLRRVAAAAASAVATVVVIVATATGAAAKAPSQRLCPTANMTVQFYYTDLRVFMGSDLLWKKPSTISHVTHTLPAVTVTPGSRISFTGRRDTAPDPHAIAVRVDWAPDETGATRGAPLLSSTDWEVARVSEAFASTLAANVAPAEWARVVDVSNAVSAETKRAAPEGALHVAAAEPENNPDAKFWVAFRSPSTPTEGGCSSAAAGDSGTSLSSGATAAISVVSVALVLAVIGGVVWVLGARQRRRMRAIDESEDGWPPKPVSDVAGGDEPRGCGDGSTQGEPQADPVAPSASDRPPYKVGSIGRGGASGGGSRGGGNAPATSAGSPPSDARSRPCSSATTGSPPANARSSVEDIRAQALAAQALEADVADAAVALYEDSVATGKRGTVRGGGGALLAADGVVGSSIDRSSSHGGGEELPNLGRTQQQALTGTGTSGGTPTLGSGSLMTGSLVSSFELPAAASPPQVVRGVALPDDDGLFPPPLPSSLWTPLPSPGV